MSLRSEKVKHRKKNIVTTHSFTVSHRGSRHQIYCDLGFCNINFDSCHFIGCNSRGEHVMSCKVPRYQLGLERSTSTMTRSLSSMVSNKSHSTLNTTPVCRVRNETGRGRWKRMMRRLVGSCIQRLSSHCFSQVGSSIGLDVKCVNMQHTELFMTWLICRRIKWLQTIKYK
jgi:hypothetical protein